jgi:dTDP-4-amino-4,6-dideoxygalactose transaminase
VLVCKTVEMADRVVSIIDCGRPHDPEGMEYTFGANYRMSELHAALACVGLERFPEQAQQREESAAYLDEALSEIPGVRVLRRDPRHTRRAYYLYMFAIEPDLFGAEHEVVSAALEAEGIPASAGWPPMHRYPMFQPRLCATARPDRIPGTVPISSKCIAGSRTHRRREQALWLGEAVLRAGRQGVEDVVAAVGKVWENRRELG